MLSRLTKEQRKQAGIYQIINLLNGESYIGSTVEFGKRLVKHLYELRSGKHPNKHLLSAFQKAGKLSFEFRVLVVVEPEEYPTTGRDLPDAFSFERRCVFPAGSRLGANWFLVGHGQGKLRLLSVRFS